MAKIVWKGGVLTSPVPPVLVTCGTLEKPNVLTVAWTGTLCSTPPITYISVRPERYSHALIRESGEFVINLASTSMVRAVDGCGVYTGAKVNKFEKYKLETQPASAVACPLLAASPLALECRVIEEKHLGSHDMFIAEIVAVDLEDKLLDEAGKLHLEKADLLAYSHGDYFALGRKLGGFGFSVRKACGRNGYKNTK